ncbi:MAG: hypothetical protein ABFD89_17665 [Bryobacteraceae bacterium]
MSGSIIALGPFAGRYSGYEQADLSISAATLTTTAGTKYSDAIELGKPVPCTASINSTSMSTSDTLDVTIEGSEGGTFTAPDLETLATFTQITDAAGGVTAQTKSFTGMKYIRSKYVTGGTTVTAACTCLVKVGF